MPSGSLFRALTVTLFVSLLVKKLGLGQKLKLELVNSKSRREGPSTWIESHDSSILVYYR